MVNVDYCIGKRYGFVVVLRYIGCINYKHIVFGLCDCGNEKQFRLQGLENGTTKSCGCYKKLIDKKNLGRATHRLIKHPLYTVWCGMKYRCADKNDKDYGGKGVAICDEWKNDFKSFYDWAIKNGWEKGLQIDKDIIPKKLGIPAILYSPETCCFVTHKVNSDNRTNGRLFKLNRNYFTLAQLSDKYNINYKALFARIHTYGWSVSLAVKTPLRNYKI